MRKKALLMMLCVALLCAFVLLLPRLQTDSESSQPVTRSAELGLVLLDESGGLFVLAISDQSPAWRAGILAGDLLTRAGDVPLTSVLQLEEMLLSAPRTLPITLDRSGDIMTLQLSIH